mmetsp:Transcript_9258/g.18226  ORF Transcript_9258/g.18226 Transcript_9258/m.18226 type:complete len:326 (-) Transcript_9258:1265-2242(-)
MQVKRVHFTCIHATSLTFGGCQRQVWPMQQYLVSLERGCTSPFRELVEVTKDLTGKEDKRNGKHNANNLDKDTSLGHIRKSNFASCESNGRRGGGSRKHICEGGSNSCREAEKKRIDFLLHSKLKKNRPKESDSSSVTNEFSDNTDNDGNDGNKHNWREIGHADNEGRDLRGQSTCRDSAGNSETSTHEKNDTPRKTLECTFVEKHLAGLRGGREEEESDATKNSNSAVINKTLPSVSVDSLACSLGGERGVTRAAAKKRVNGVGANDPEHYHDNEDDANNNLITGHDTKRAAFASKTLRVKVNINTTKKDEANDTPGNKEHDKG